MSYQPGDPEGAVRLAVQASRALAAAGQSDMVWGHASVRDPGGRGAWMKSAGWGLEEIDAAKIVLVSPDGTVLDSGAASGEGPRHIEYPIQARRRLVRPAAAGGVGVPAAPGRAGRLIRPRGRRRIPGEVPPVAERHGDGGGSALSRPPRRRLDDVEALPATRIPG